MTQGRRQGGKGVVRKKLESERRCAATEERPRPAASIVEFAGCGLLRRCTFGAVMSLSLSTSTGTYQDCGQEARHSIANRQQQARDGPEM